MGLDPDTASPFLDLAIGFDPAMESSFRLEEEEEDMDGSATEGGGEEGGGGGGGREDGGTG